MCKLKKKLFQVTKCDFLFQMKNSTLTTSLQLKQEK